MQCAYLPAFFLSRYFVSKRWTGPDSVTFFRAFQAHFWGEQSYDHISFNKDRRSKLITIPIWVKQAQAILEFTISGIHTDHLWMLRPAKHAVEIELYHCFRREK